MVNCSMRLVISFLLLLMPGILLGQSNNSSDEADEDVFSSLPFKKRMYIGGELTAYFGTENLFMIAPLAGYNLTKDFSVGIGSRYIWMNSRVWNYNHHIYGASVFARYLIADVVILHAEFEKINVEYYSTFEGRNRRRWIDVGLVGGGYQQNLGERSYLQFLILYDVINDRNSPYSTAFDIPLVFRTGFIFRL